MITFLLGFVLAALFARVPRAQGRHRRVRPVMPRVLRGSTMALAGLFLAVAPLPASGLVVGT